MIYKIDKYKQFIITTRLSKICSWAPFNGNQGIYMILRISGK